MEPRRPAHVHHRPAADRARHRGRAHAGARLAEVEFAQVLTSPRQRARHTAELVGFADAEVDEDLVEWAYGDYEGISTAVIRETVPGWTVWSHPTPQRRDRRRRSPSASTASSPARDRATGRTLVFGHGHALRALTARWLEQPVDEGRYFRLDTSTLSVLGWERETPVLLRWNS